MDSDSLSPQRSELSLVAVARWHEFVVIQLDWIRGFIQSRVGAKWHHYNFPLLTPGRHRAPYFSPVSRANSIMCEPIALRISAKNWSNDSTNQMPPLLQRNLKTDHVFCSPFQVFQSFRSSKECPHGLGRRLQTFGFENVFGNWNFDIIILIRKCAVCLQCYLPTGYLWKFPEYLIRYERYQLPLPRNVTYECSVRMLRTNVTYEYYVQTFYSSMLVT